MGHLLCPELREACCKPRLEVCGAVLPREKRVQLSEGNLLAKEQIPLTATRSPLAAAYPFGDSSHLLSCGQ